MAVQNKNKLPTGIVLPPTVPINSDIHPAPELKTISKSINLNQSTSLVQPGLNAGQAPIPSSPTPPVGPPPTPPPQPPPRADMESEVVSPFSLRRFLLTRVAPIGAIVGVILLLGYFIDPMGIFRNTDSEDGTISLRSAPLFSDVGKLITLAGDTEVQATLNVIGDLTAPNVLYSITAGDNIIISGDGQRPTISASLNEADSLQTVSSRGANTSLRLTLLGGATLGDVLGLATRGEDPSGGSNGSLYYNTTSNKFRCYTNGAWENGEIETVQDATKICEASIKLLTTLYNLTHDGKILQMSDQLKDINQIIQQL